MSNFGSRLAVFILNIVVALLSIAAIAATLVGPLWTVKVDYLLKAETLEELLGERAQDIDLSETVGDGVPRMSIFSLHNATARPKRPRRSS